MKKTERFYVELTYESTIKKWHIGARNISHSIRLDNPGVKVRVHRAKEEE